MELLKKGNSVILIIYWSDLQLAHTDIFRNYLYHTYFRSISLQNVF